ncbi:VOC family protein [Leucobacter luti]|uniref:VOC family protein n=1 Tax=Leucobacter luti TaxID=340320 RepID=UPI00215D7654|nr:VOC family protein [Leucobacter luti]
MNAAQKATRNSARTPLLITAGVVIIAIVAGAVWWFASRADSASAENPVGAGTAAAGSAVTGEVRGPAGAPSERADGLPAETAMGVNELKVRDLAAVRAYYEDAIGLSILEERAGEALLGLAKTPLIRLTESKEPLPKPDDAGLYHTAILYPDEATLAQTLLRVAEQAPASFQGSADHRVSQAFYFGDPEGNGLELYVDRPEEEWTWVDGQVVMGSDALDPNEFITTHLGGEALGTAAMGHVHLKVGDLDEAREFYADTLGFDVVSEADGALFYSAGGYHHHLATNTWMSSGAGPRSTDVGLGSVSITLPDAASVDAVAERARAAGVAVDAVAGGIFVADPWGNLVRVVV